MIPRHLDAPPMLLLWELDEAAAFMVPMLFFMLFEMFIPGVVVGFLLQKCVSLIKAQGGKRLLQQALYWYTPSDVLLTLKATPKSHIREYYG